MGTVMPAPLGQGQERGQGGRLGVSWLLGARGVYGVGCPVASPGVRAALRPGRGTVEDTPSSSPFLGWRGDQRAPIIVLEMVLHSY